MFIAFTYYKSHLVQLISGTLGLSVAIVLHALFNFFIINSSGTTILSVFLFVWIGIIILFLLFERIKLLEQNHNLSTNL